MTTERIKSIGILIATLIIGVFFGLLVPGLFHKFDRRQGMGRGGPMPERRGDWFVTTLNRVVKPTDEQQEKFKPVADWAAARLDSIEQSANAEAKRVLDSVKTQLHPIVTEEQWSRLEKFDEHAKERWHGRGPRGGRGRRD